MKYTKETKVDVVKRYLAGEKADVLIKEIGLSRSTIYLWVKQFNEEALKKENQISVCNYRKLQNKVKRLEEMIKIYKKVNCNYNSPLKEKLYALEELYGQYSIHILCDTFDIARGTFYNHILRNKKTNTIYVKRKEKLKELIQKVYDENNQIFGAGKIAVVLKEQGIKTSEKTISLLMREMGIKSIRLEAKNLYDKEKKQKRNLIQQQFNPIKPNQVWVSDITYFRFKEKTYYICANMDLFSRIIISYKIGLKNSTQLTKSTFKMAYTKRQPKNDLIFHTDNGSNYCSKAFQEYLFQLNFTHSFSRPHVPYDNSVMESFFASLKKEELYKRIYKSEKELFNAINDYMIFYNEKRPHYQNNYKTPIKKEAEYFLL